MIVIETYLEHMREYTDAVDDFLLASGLHLLSSTIGKFIGVINLPTTGDRYVKPNLWFLILGEPNISRKSTVITMERKIVEKTWRRFYVEYEGLDEDEADKKSAAMFIEQGSAEGIADQITLAQKEFDLDTFYIMSAEWGNVFSEMKNRTYLNSLASLLSKLWDGDRYSWVGSRRVKNAFDRYIREGTYVTAMIGIQRAGAYIDELFLQQGLMRRFFIVNTIGVEKNRYLPVIYSKREDVVAYLLGDKYFVGELVRLMGEYYDLCTNHGIVLAMMNSEAEELINKFAENIEGRTEGAEEWRNYISGAWQHVLRISIMFAASREYPRSMHNIAYLPVTGDDVEKAIEMYDRLEPKIMEAIVDILSPQQKQPHIDTSSIQERVMAVVEEGRNRGKTFRELCRRIRNRREVLEAVLELMAQGRVAVFKIPPPGRGRPSYRVISSRYRDNPDPIFYSGVELSEPEEVRKALLIPRK